MTFRLFSHAFSLISKALPRLCLFRSYVHLAACGFLSPQGRTLAYDASASGQGLRRMWKMGGTRIT